jgi:hypothetical protein
VKQLIRDLTSSTKALRPRQFLAAVLLVCGFQQTSLARSISILFVGNSLTYFNAMPSMVRELAEQASPPQQVRVELIASAGATIREHLMAGTAQRLFTSHHYDFVVFQEVGGFPLCSEDFPGCTDSPAAIAELVQQIKRAGAVPVWYSTYVDQADQESLSELVEKSATGLGVRIWSCPYPTGQAAG